ncbi:hypothetical protein J7T55_013951 [Diaporthe amygdali]|uniref:uncharacterized protein n=1 Tax=Phomopsis amygdali TaxID=1214568 RepID=UPI0022FDDF2D|nr:uncharacterized protein J7T55_013951 [Diaporthe amygdali]KAJ0119747.1 hypothetical protein J7T55_013951 [Diaporthe amygdali]
MAQIQTRTFNTRATLPKTSPLYIGSFDDNMLCHGPQFVKPIDTSFITTQITSFSKRSSLTASPLSESDEDSAVLGDDDEFSEDELPPSPIRRHSGAMSVSQEELPFCLNREALRRETAAHRAQQHLAHEHKRERAGTFAAHEQWDSEIDGPSMSLWIPQASSTTEHKRRRTEKPLPAKKVPAQHHVQHIEGPMMSLWEA